MNKPTPTRVFAALVALMAWIAVARADDLLDRSVHLNVAAAPLASALVEFSAQSGVQIAVADQDVARFKSHGVQGDYTVHEALSLLLQGTHLDFSRVGVSTVAIRDATTPAGNLSATLPDVGIIAPRPPTDQELAEDSVSQFILHHATTPFPKSVAVGGSLTRWLGGKSDSICPRTLGLDPGYNAFVTARVRALATDVGAPVQPDLLCEDNVRFVFTTDPEKLMRDEYAWAVRLRHVKHPFQEERLLEQSGTHAIQGWYITENGGAHLLNSDIGMYAPWALLPVWPLAIQTGLHGNGCCYGSIIGVTIVVNTTKVTGYTIGSVADYLGMLTLTLTQSPDHCDRLPSILDLMSSACGEREKPAGITAGDVTFLKALYYRNTGLGPTLSRDDIQFNMMHQFKGR